jgi:hypothetical protein
MSQYTPPLTYKHQADATLSQANPVSTTLYTVLNTTRDVRLRSINANITWAVTQPTPLEIVVTIDGQTITYIGANPVSATEYEAKPNKQNSDTNQYLGVIVNDVQSPGGFLLEGKSVRVQVRVTWAVTQPTLLVCRVKYAKLV